MIASGLTAVKRMTAKTSIRASRKTLRRFRERPAARANRMGKTSVRQGHDQSWDHRLGFLMHDVSRLRRSVFDEYMKPAGVTRSQWWVLAHLSRHDGMIQSDLADMLELGKAALGGLIDRLAAAGFIERRPDDNDRRVKRVYLSSEGTRMIREMSERVLEGLDPTLRHQLADWLSLVKANLLKIRDELGGTGDSDPS
jgi:MarR family transcriptional regulator, transcriptional regulator for hemolysin